MNSFLFKLKPSGKEWVILGVSFSALVLALLAFLGAVFSLGTFFVQKELPWQAHTSWFSNEADLNNLNQLNLAQASGNNLQNIRDQVAVLAAELEAVKANSLKAQSAANSKNNLINNDLASIQLAKMDLHLALSELGQGGDLKLILGFLNDASQELLLGHRLVESKLLDSVIENLKNNQNSLMIFAGSQDKQDKQDNKLASFNDLMKNLSTLSFQLPVDPQAFNQINHDLKINNPEINNPEINNPEINNPEINNPEINNPNDNIWLSGLKQSWERLRNLLVIRENQTVGENLLLDSAREAVTMSIVLDLQEAQSLLLSGQYVSYENRLDRVKSKIEIDFQDNAAKQIFLNNLENLSISPEIAEETAIKNSILKILGDLNQDSLSFVGADVSQVPQVSQVSLTGVAQ